MGNVVDELRACIIKHISTFLKESGMTQVAASKIMGTSQCNVSHLVNQRHEFFTIDRLVLFAKSLNIMVGITVQIVE